MKCKHKWEEDERFEDGGIMMFFGKVGEVKRETRMVCKNCGAFDYIKVPISDVSRKEARA